MNDNRSLHDELAHEARHIPLTSTGIEVILETAGRRRRRRNVAAVGSVVAVTAVTVVGIQQLSRVDAPEVALSPPETIVPVDTTIPAVEVATTTSVAGAGVPGLGIDLSGAVPAEPTAPVMTWAVVDADSAEALALRYGSSSQRYALATEPGANEPGRRALYEQRDGAWVQIAADVLPDGLSRATLSGDAIYAVGTAPATAGDMPGSVGRFDIASQSWELLALPAEARPYRSDKVMSWAEMSIAPIDEGALVLITRSAGSIDFAAIEAAANASGAVYDFRWVDDRFEVSKNCDQPAIDQAMNELFETAPTVPPDASHDPYRQLTAEFCELVYLTADELGLSADDVTELDRQNQVLIYRYDGGTLTPVESPTPEAQSAYVQRDVLTLWSNSGTEMWLVRGDGTFGPAFTGVGPLEGVNTPRQFDGVLSTAVGGVVLTGEPGGQPSLVDLSAIFADDTMLEPTTWINSVAANDAATVAAAAIDFRRAVSITEPTTIEGATYNLVVDPENGITVVERATGRRLADGYQLATAPGALELLAHSGADLVYSDSPTTTVVPATVPVTTMEVVPDSIGDPAEVIDQFDVDWKTLAPWSSDRTTKIASSIDGRSYAVESFADLVGAGPGEHAEMGFVDIVDGRFIVRGTVWSDGVDGRSVILIGTPNG